MNFKSIIGIFKGISLPRVKTPLGRWNIHNHRETILKIKYATEDNCGISYHNYNNISEYFTNVPYTPARSAPSHPLQIQKNNELYDDNKYIYMMGYESLH